MAIGNPEFDTIMRIYDDTRLHNQQIHDDRVKEVYEKVDGYRELDETTISVSLDAAKKRIAGQANAVSELHSLLEELKSIKRSLLTGAGYPVDYLDPIYSCKDCKDTGFIGSERCHCLKQRIIDRAYAISNIREYIDENNFSTLSYEYYKGEDLERFKKVVATCHEFIDTFDETTSNILFYGSVATGKSFLSGCIAKELLDSGHTVAYFSSSGLFDALARDTFENGNKENLYKLYDYIYNCDLLIIDDLGTELINSFVSSQLFTCINERALRKKHTIISTNLSLEQIRDRYSDRVFSRIVSSFAVCKITGPDIRILKRTS